MSPSHAAQQVARGSTAGGTSPPTAGDDDRATARRRSDLRAVAVPTEHGGWGLTLEPAVAGLIVAPTAAGVCLAAAALVAFVARTPLRVLLVDQHRHRHLDRTAVAARVLAVELAVLVALVVAAALLADARFWWPAVVAAPLIGVELAFERRSRSRRLVPELAGAVGIGAVAAMIVAADGADAAVAVALWLVLAARASTSIPFVRAQVQLLHDRVPDRRAVLAGDLVALCVAAVAIAVDTAAVAGAIAVAVVVCTQRVTGRRPPARAAVLGARQTVLGLAVAVAAALGFLAP